MPQSSTAPMGRFAPNTLSQLEPQIHKEIKGVLGFSEPTLLQAALNAIQAGGQEQAIESRLSTMLESRKAQKLSRKIYGAVDEFCVTHELPRPAGEESDRGSRKRKADQDEGEATVAKKPVEGSMAAMSAEQIRAIMSNTKKQIEERKRQLQVSLAAAKPALGQPTSGVVGPQKPAPADASEDKFKSIAALQAQIQSRMEKMKLPVATGPTSLILDAEGRTVDASGQEIQLTQHVPTLKANLRAKKRDEMKEHLKEGPGVVQVDQESKFFDPRVVGKGVATRAHKRAFRFNEPGKFQNEGNRLRMKAQLEKLQADIASVARRTGISSATQLAKLVPKEAEKGRIPEVEWWDSHLMHPDSTYAEPVFREGAITNLIEHPIQLKPLESSQPEQIPVYLTKKERKKLRRQNRREAEKEKQDKIRLGLVNPDEPKVKMSNLMRVLGTEAVQDPTKIEAHVRAQMAKRLDTHEKANAERKLTPEERKAKVRRKLEEDTSFGVHVSIYRIKSLMNPAKKFKVMTNANQLTMSGCVVYYEDVNVVVVEGGPKQQKKYKQLMLNRIKWDEETYKRSDGTEADNGCTLVWEGQTKERHFKEMMIKQCPSESFARDFFRKFQVEHFWDLAYSASVQDDL
ncbi:U4/U6 small nuclear ribonucleoprotein Prp3-like isoform X2 [Tigriopus californicus]|uniref:U4/U6 small nuclear ribonucleoprotein Prp3-like isoform X2 n=1 Tax=Tigriopus californicus TaxID=6832 RepID=UPI0027DA1C96|nr:U4/U6 small nuclear ribonucleoprotein Prp3-like isoform X2 [Tigriopus californicus]|eukprot:TCALIF_07621-PA protein Name:"Similar to PRPF3 U4/U6 small nuclear ribonucleoprotein Prp3 (Gallus gallus)" AED:0.00 eAED:0.00 QI:199/1/0.5/1/0/0/2/0/628